MAIRPREAALLALVVSLLVMGAVSGLPSVPLSPAPEEPSPGRLIALDEDGPAVWPYVAAGRSFARPASPINLVFDADPARVQGVFVRGFDEVNVTASGTPTHPPPAEWRVLESAPRYAYVSPSPDAVGEWREPAYQLHHGSYFGSQSHLRVYDASTGGERWTAVQAHAEHWDWFALTHRVDSVERPRQEIERLLFDDPTVSEVRRVYFGNGDVFDADGWTTVVGLAALVAVSGASALSGRRQDRWRLALLLAVAAVPLLVRVVGVVAGDAGLDHDLVSRSLYVVLVLGTPAAAVLGGRRLPPWEGFALAGAGFAAAVVLDYTYLDVHVVQLPLVAHRSLAAVAVGLLAAGTVDADGLVDPRLAAGLVLWLVAVAVPHVRV